MAIISFLVALVNAVFYIYLFYGILNGSGEGMLAPGLYCLFYGWILPVLGFLPGMVGLDSSYKKIAIVGVVLSGCGLVFYVLAWLNIFV